MAEKLERVAKAIAGGCYDELVEKAGISREQYVEQYWHLFKSAARAAMDELETA